MVSKNPDKVQGNCCFCTLFLMRILNNQGINICAMITTQEMPMMEIRAMDLSAGCLAKINTPRPAMVVIADRKMDDLKEARFFLPVLYSCRRPSMMYRL